MADSAINRMRNLQVFLFCAVDGVSILLNTGIVLMLLFSKKCRMHPSNRFLASIIAFQLVTALSSIVFAVKFPGSDTEELQEDTIIVQITFSLLGLGLCHFMLIVDRIVSVNMKSEHSFVITNKQTWLMIALSWIIPTAVAIASALIVSKGQPSSEVSYALETLSIATGLTSTLALIGLSVYLYKETAPNRSSAYRSTRRLKNRTIFEHEKEIANITRICIAMAVSNVILMFPQILFAFGKLLNTRGLLDTWFMQLSCTLMLCSGVVDASLYIYMNKSMRKSFQAKVRNLCGRNDKEKAIEMEDMCKKSTEKEYTDNEDDLDWKTKELMLPQEYLKKDIEVMLL